MQLISDPVARGVAFEATARRLRNASNHADFRRLLELARENNVELTPATILSQIGVASSLVEGLALETKLRALNPNECGAAQFLIRLAHYESNFKEAERIYNDYSKILSQKPDGLMELAQLTNRFTQYFPHASVLTFSDVSFHYHALTLIFNQFGEFCRPK